MSLRISNIRLRIEEPEAALRPRLAKLLGVSEQDAPPYRILRKALDARDYHSLSFVYTAEVQVPDEDNALLRLGKTFRSRRERIDRYHQEPFRLQAMGTRVLAERPIVIGSGPGGLTAAYFLAELGYRPLVIERGRRVNERIRDVRAFDEGGPHDPESNYLFGEGGAGTFSDGKLTYRGSGPDVHRVLELFAECKGKPSILYDARPHLGSNRLPAVVKALRRRIEALGGEVRFSCRFEDLDVSDGRVRGIATSSGYLPAAVVGLAIGHSARDTYEMLLRRGVPMERKPFQMGVRIEQPQE
ncbi:MAG: NAD(P)/FAD-dependent oxidoreductase, partial [Gemmataceae bacterium]